jgi:hypothetical protein
MPAHRPVDPGRSQAWHAPVQAVSQHSPCAQCRVVHSSSLEHGAGGGFLPHDPFMHTLGATHWLSLLHAEKHRAPLQW